MPTEPKDLFEARQLLSKFEERMESAEGVINLSAALSLLSDVAPDAASTEWNRCSSIVSAYAIKAQEKVEPLLIQEPEQLDDVYWERTNHWRKVLKEFESVDFPLPDAVTQCLSQLLDSMAHYIILLYKRAIGQDGDLSPSEMEALIRALQQKSPHLGPMTTGTGARTG